MKAIFITTRSQNTRYPGKSFKQFNYGFKSKNSTDLIIDIAKKSKHAERIIFCVPDNPADRVFQTIAINNDCDFFAGSEPDKIDRYRRCCEFYGVEFFVNIDGDDPFTSPELIDLAFEQYERTGADYIYQKDLIIGSFTHGVKYQALKTICKIKETYDTEMIHRYFLDTGLFRCEELQNVPEVYRDPAKKWRFTFDYREDFEFFNHLVQRDILTIPDARAWSPESCKINNFRNKEFHEKQARTSHLKIKNPPKHIGNELEYLEKVLNSENWAATSGSWNNELEKRFAETFGAKYAVAMNSGTATLHAALVALGVGPGDEVITPALTVFMDTSAIIHAGAKPVYADIDRDTWIIDPMDIEAKITPRTKAIIAVGLYGLEVPQSVFNVARKYNIPVIEDNAQAFNKSFRGEIASYSFENTKHISCGEGGIIITNDEKLAEICRKVAGHGFKNLKADEGRIRLNQDVFQDPDYKRHDMIGWNYRMPEFNAAIALAQLERLDQLVEMRQRVAKLFIDVIDDCHFMDDQLRMQSSRHSYYTLGALFFHRHVSWGEFRRKYIELGGDGIYAAWSVPYLEPAFRKCSYLVERHCPVAEKLQPRLMQFKTNYRSMAIAEEKAEALRRTIKFYA
jgi:perosamine synthetase